MTPETMTLVWLPIHLRSLHVPHTIRPDYGNWVAALRENAAEEVAKIPETWGPQMLTSLDPLVDEIVAMLTGCLPPKALDWVRRRDQAAADSLQVALHVWTLSAAEVLAEGDPAGLDRWRGRRAAAADAARAVTDADAPHLAVLRPRRGIELGA